MKSSSAAETKVLIDFYTNVITPTLVLGIESSGNYVKFPYNYANDDTNSLANSSTFGWFYNSLATDINELGQGISTGNYLSLLRRTNNGDNDDYFRGIKRVMAYTMNIGSNEYGTLHLNQTTSAKIDKIITENIDLGIYAIEKSGEQISVKINHFDV